MSKNRMDRPQIVLAEYLSPSRFRTVDSFAMQQAPSELRVEFELSDAFMKKLSFNVPWDGNLYAYAVPKEKFYKLCERGGLFADRDTTLYFQDWDTKFLLAIEKAENDRRQFLTYFVSYEDIYVLLENCCRIPEQKGSREKK